MKHMIILALISFSAFPVENSPLPNWVDESREKKITNNRVFIPWRNLSTPPSFYLPAEYEPVQAIVIGNRGYPEMLSSIADISSNSGMAEVWNANGPRSMINVSSDLYTKINCQLNSVWMRDYGPVGVVNSSGEHAIVDTVYRHFQYRLYDDALPTCLGNQQGINTYQIDLILDGGNLMVDTAGNLFMTDRTYLWNSDKSREEVNEILKDTFNVDHIISFEYAGYPDRPLDGTGHIDMIIKLVDDHKVVIAESDHPEFKRILDQAVEYFSTALAPDGGFYEIYRVPGYYRGRTWYTYANSLIVNDTVLVPSFRGNSNLNEEALAAYQHALPDHNIELINSDQSIRAGGSIHCVTQTIPEI